MSYVGNIPAEKYSSLTQQTFSSPTGTSFTLSQSVTNSTDIALFVDNVRQDPSTYTAVGTALTTSTISSPSTMYCLYNGRTTETVSPPAGSVDSSQLVAGSVDDSHISGLAASKLTGVVAPANLGTGTASSSTFLNGAGAYAEAGGGKVVQVVSVNKRDTASTTSTSYGNISGLAVTITPTASSSKVLILVSAGLGLPTGTNSIFLQLTGGNAGTHIGDANSPQTRCAVSYGSRVNDAYGQAQANIMYLDSPSTTSATTYQVQWKVNGATGYLNRSVTLDANNGATTASITVMEVGA
jgi:hypothetical protein